MLEEFELTKVWNYSDGEAVLKKLRGNEKWKILSNLAEKDENYLYNIFNNLINVKLINKVFIKYL